MQANVYPGLGLWRRVDWPILCIERPPAFWVAVHHPPLDIVQSGILDRLVRRVEDNRRPAHAHDARGRIQHDHAIANRAIRQMKALQKDPAAA
jgi:hypothetical protein